MIDGRVGADIMRAAFSDAPIGLAVTEVDGTFVHVNTAMCGLLARPPGDLLGRNLADVVHPDDAVAEQAHLARVRAGEVDGFDHELRLVRPDGSIVVAHERVSRLRPSETGEAAVLWQMVDVTEQREREAAIVRAYEEARSADRAKTTFISQLSHELRTPLSVIIGFAELLEVDVDTAEGRRALGFIRMGADHAKRLLDGLLDVGRIEAGDLKLATEPVDVARVVKEAIELVSPMAEQYSVRIVLDAGPAGTCFRADRGRYLQVLLNLLTNAIKFSREGVVTVNVAVSRDDVLVRVADSGPGLTPEEISRLFRPFERLGAESMGVPGVGLGLVVSKTLMEAMGGSLEVVSVRGAGAMFSTRLALTTAGLTADGTDVVDEPLLLSGSPLVVCVEDDPASAGLVRELLARYSDARLKVATTGWDGVAAVREGCDIVLLDRDLPGLSGEHVLELLRSEPQADRVPVIILSAEARPDEISRLLGAGADAYVTKPLDVRDLLGTMARLLGRPLPG